MKKTKSTIGKLKTYTVKAHKKDDPTEFFIENLSGLKNKEDLRKRLKRKGYVLDRATEKK